MTEVEPTVGNVTILKPKSLLGIRHVQIALLFFAMLFTFFMRVSMSMGIVAMTDPDADNTFDWSIQRQSVILSSFFWGYIILQIPGGELAAKYGGSILLTIVVAGNAVITLLIPLAGNYGGWGAVCACRALQGLSQGLMYPTMHNLIGKWIPFEEKSLFGTIIYAGSDLGAAIQFLVAGFIADAWGWPAIFYVNGTLGAIWTIFYVILGSDSPQHSKMISSEERLYIQSSLGQVGEQKKLKTPWKAMATSLPFYALIVAQCGHSWGFWTLMPTYMKQILEVDIKANGLISALPYFVVFLLGFPFGYISDYAVKNKWVSVNTSRKISNTIGECGPAIALVGFSYVPAGNLSLAVALLTIAIGLTAGHYTGFLMVHIDMAPNYAGSLMGIANFFANIFATISPLIAGLILQDETDPTQWRQAFYLSAAVYIAANLFFVLFGSSDRQPWNEPEEPNNGTEKNVEKVA